MTPQTKNIDRAISWLHWTLALALAGSTWACGGGDDPLLDGEPFDFETGAAGLTKTQGGNNGASNYCADPMNPCLAGEGDCDADVECETGLICGTDNGRNYGFSRAVDVCVAAHCVNGIRDADEAGQDCGGADCPACDCSGLPAQNQAGHCTAECPCTAGEGDCDVDDQCDTGLICLEGNGRQFGLTNGADLCVDPTCDNGVLDLGEVTVDCGGGCGTVCPNSCANQPVNGNINRCDPTCTCAVQEGDCDSDADCDGTAICVSNVGGAFGFSSSIDMCLAATCTNGTQDGDETGVDCGPSCVPCAGKANFIDNLGGANLERASDVAVDNNGNVYIIGQYRTSTDLGGGTLTATGSSPSADEIFVAKYDAFGSHQWSSTFGAEASDGDRGLGIGVSGLGEVVITGSFRRSIDFGGGSFSNPSGADVFVAVFETDGMLRWADTFGAQGAEDSGLDATFDRGGNVLVTGFFSDTIDFGGGTLTSTGGRDIFVVRFDGDGNHQDSARFGGSGKDVGRSIGTDDRRRVYVTGAFRGSVAFGANSFTGRGSDDVFILMLGRTSFSVGWAVQYGGRSNDFSRGIAVDRSGRLVVGGGFTDIVRFGTTTATSAGQHDAFLVQLDSLTGSQQWVRTFGDTGDDEIQAVALDRSSGEIAAAGYFGAAMSVGSVSLSHAGALDSFLVRYDSSGSLLEAFGDGGTGNDLPSGIDFNQGYLAYFGEFSGSMTLLGENLSAIGSDDLFLAIIQP